MSKQKRFNLQKLVQNLSDKNRYQQREDRWGQCVPLFDPCAGVHGGFRRFPTKKRSGPVHHSSGTPRNSRKNCSRA